MSGEAAVITDARITLDAAERVELRLAARKRGLKHKDIARQIGVDPRTLAKYACGERRPTVDVLQAWQRVLGIQGKE